MAMDLGFESSEDYLKVAHKFKLGFLPTEKSHAKTWELSELSKNNLPKAIQVLKSLDVNVLSVLQEKNIELQGLSKKIRQVFADGGRVFLFGCGATGRLSLLIESIWNQVNPDKVGKVMSFMSGGDIALVQSVEGFEDQVEYGARHLRDLGFSEKDLLISSTEGGETPIVIGATLEATKISKHKSYYLYCNPTQLLVDNIERSKKVIENEMVEPIELYCGSMAVAGSTRMQASSILQIFISMALFMENPEDSMKELGEFKNYFESLDISFLEEFIKKEAGIYVSFGRLTYYVDERLALNTFTDTTERAPTFSMKPFEHPDELTLPLSLCYICIKGASSSMDAWEKLLYRKPKALDWQDSIARVSQSYLQGFDFSQNAIDKREAMSPSKNSFNIDLLAESISWELNGLSYNVPVPKAIHYHWQQVLLKFLLNAHSTLIMGRLRRYENNLMTWVSPSNGKLIDRTARYVDHLLKAEGINKTYEEIVKAIFDITLKKDRSMVLEIFHHIKRDYELTK